MITLLMAISTDNIFLKYIGIAVSIIEVLLVVVKFLSYLFDNTTKFGKILRKIFKGLQAVKSELQPITTEQSKETDKDKLKDIEQKEIEETEKEK